MDATNEGFRCFDVVSEDNIQHRFVGKNSDSGNCFNDRKSKVYKNIMKEWRILDKNLPESIYVRAYERRIDLLRAVIIGIAGTPYHDGLFFFDIAFPDDYPNNPPKIHFYSYGYSRLNPNFLSNGVVCVSLLNTTVGQKEEMWDPSRSTILQVLLSIQALILTENPLLNYFSLNHNGFTRTVFSTFTRIHNESAFLDTCRISLCLIRNPPLNFESFVLCHFRQRGFAILCACNEYVNGRSIVGYYGCDLNTHSLLPSMKAKKASKSFRHALNSSIYQNLYEAFLECGAFLGHGVERLELPTERPQRFKKVITKIKHALEWKGKSSLKNSKISEKTL